MPARALPDRSPKPQFNERALAAWIASLDGKAGIASDPKTTGLFLRSRTRQAAFYVVRQADGKRHWIKLGEFGVMTVHEARVKALETIRSITLGELSAKPAKSKTVKQAFEDYLEKVTLRPSTEAKYRRVLKLTFTKLADVPVSAVDPSDVVKLYTERCMSSPAVAAHDLRVLLSVIKFSGVATAPITIAMRRRWVRVERRQSALPPRLQREWMDAIRELRDPCANVPIDMPASWYSEMTQVVDEPVRVVRLRILTLLELQFFTGLRWRELAGLTVDEVDKKSRSLVIPESRMKNKRRLIRPLGRSTWEIIEGQLGAKTSGLLFPGAKGQVIENTAAVLKLIAKTTPSSVLVCSNDLRRSWISAAVEARVPDAAVRKLIGHVDASTLFGYQALDLEYLRREAERVEDLLWLRVHGQQ